MPGDVRAEKLLFRELLLQLRHGRHGGVEGGNVVVCGKGAPAAGVAAAEEVEEVALPRRAVAAVGLGAGDGAGQDVQQGGAMVAEAVQGAGAREGVEDAGVDEGVRADEEVGEVPLMPARP